MGPQEVQEWLDNYIEAWRRNDRDLILALFSEDAVYRFAPWGASNTTIGREKIATAWLDDQDEPGSWDAQYTVFAIDGDRAVATGTSEYLETDTQDHQIYHNCYLMRFDTDGRCSEFVEYYMLEK